MEHEGSLLHARAPITCLHREPDQYSPCHSIPLIEDPFKHHPPIYA